MFSVASSTLYPTPAPASLDRVEQIVVSQDSPEPISKKRKATEEEEATDDAVHSKEPKTAATVDGNENPNGAPSAPGNSDYPKQAPGPFLLGYYSIQNPPAVPGSQTADISPQQPLHMAQLQSLDLRGLHIRVNTIYGAALPPEYPTPSGGESAIQDYATNLSGAGFDSRPRKKPRMRWDTTPTPEQDLNAEDDFKSENTVVNFYDVRKGGDHCLGPVPWSLCKTSNLLFGYAANFAYNMKATQCTFLLAKINDGAAKGHTLAKYNEDVFEELVEKIENDPCWAEGGSKRCVVMIQQLEPGLRRGLLG